MAGTAQARLVKDDPWSASHRAQKILVILHGVTARPRREAWIATNQREKAATATVKPSDDFDQSEPLVRRHASCGNVSPVIDPWARWAPSCRERESPALRGFREG